MTEETETPGPRRSARRGRFDLRHRQMRAGVVTVVALVIGVGVWVAIRGGGGSSASSPVPQTTGAVPVSPSGLRTLASAVNQPIYWAGPQSGRQYELTRATDGRVWVRYLPSSEKIGEQSTPYLTIGTYPVKNAFAATASVAKQKGATRVPAGKGAIAFYSAAHPTSVYLAYRGSGYQIEVFDPTAGEAPRLVASRQIKPVPGSKAATTVPQTGALAMSRKALKARAATAAGPIYWVGAEPNVTYELTQTSADRAYVRYLPAGARAGSKRPYLTIGTYPLQGALAATKAAAKGSGVVTVDVARGGFGFYNENSPTNVHLAYPGKNYQIEVYDPDPQRAHELASSPRLRPIG